MSSVTESREHSALDVRASTLRGDLGCGGASHAEDGAADRTVRRSTRRGDQRAVIARLNQLSSWKSPPRFPMGALPPNPAEGFVRVDLSTLSQFDHT